MLTPHQRGFFDLTNRYEALSQHGNPLERLAQHIPWTRFRPTLEQVLWRSKRQKGGRPLFDAVLMFKVLVLQALYNLSDDQTEYQIRDRLSFMRFLGLDLHQRIPDAKTIWLFRETLAQAGFVERLFQQFDRYLAQQGLQARGGQVIDASLVPVPIQRNTRKDNATLQAGECPVEWETHPAKRRQDEVLLAKSAGGDVWADAASRSHEIETHLQRQRLRSRIQYKGYRNTPLTATQHQTNQRRARIHARVEHVFGHQVMAMGGQLLPTIGLVRARAKLGLRNLAYNLHRFLWLTRPPGQQVV